VRNSSSRLAVGCLAAAVMALTAGSARAAAVQHQLVTVTTGGVSANEGTAQDSISLSADGRLVAFVSSSSSLVPGDANGARDVYVRDSSTGQTTLVSVGLGGQANGASSNARISADGRFVVFTSQATNLVADDTNGVADVFVRDLTSGQTARVSVSASGQQGDGPSGEAPSDISADGGVVSFSSAASNLVAGDTNRIRDVFAAVRATGAVERVSVAGDGSEAAAGASDASAISADGRYVAFASTAPNLVAGDTNLAADVFVHDRQTGSTERASVSAAGEQAAGSSSLRPGGLSADGRLVAFETAAPLAAGDTGGSDVYLRDLSTATTERISVNPAGVGANANAGAAAISSDGRYVAFESSATNLDPADSGFDEDVFVRDRVAGATRLISTSGSAIQISQTAAISGDARFIGFASTAPDLAAPDSAQGFGTGWDVFRSSSPFDPPADRTAPTVACSGDDGSWHADNVTVWCSASDAGSGLADAAQAAFLLSTHVADGSETADAFTQSVQVCDRTGNCTTAGPISGLRVDRLASQVTIATPLDGTDVEIGSALAAGFGCTDGGSGVSSCLGSVADGSALDTSSPGEHSFTVTAADAVGNEASRTVTYWVWYRWLGWEPPVAGRGRGADEAGRTIPIAFAVEGASGAELVAGVQVAAVPCSGSASVAIGDPRLGAADVTTIDAGQDGHAMVLWRTSRGFAGSCRQLLFELTDGSIHRLTFEFKPGSASELRSAAHARRLHRRHRR
jgi:Tol biopolymer transport system component